MKPLKNQLKNPGGQQKGPGTQAVAPVNVAQLSQLLNRLTNEETYDKRIRPRYGEKPVDVGVSILVSSISDVSEITMDFTLDLYVRQMWQDPRLAFDELDIGLKTKLKSLTANEEYLDKLWKPDTFFPNEKKSEVHGTLAKNSFVRIENDGTVRTSQRLTITATCPMNLRLFPMDAQRCALEIESYGYDSTDISYFWGNKRTDNPSYAVSIEEISLPQFRIAGTNVKNQTSVRNMGYYFLNIAVPAILTVAVSWLSFWIDRRESSSRVGLGITAVLTMTTLITVTNFTMPKVSYIKALDVFLFFCFFMVFATLVECALVAYVLKRASLQQNRQEIAKLEDADTEADATKGQRSFWNDTPRKMDLCSRIFFPFIFVVLSIVFWAVLAHQSSAKKRSFI